MKCDLGEETVSLGGIAGLPPLPLHPPSQGTVGVFLIQMGSGHSSLTHIREHIE